MPRPGRCPGHVSGYIAAVDWLATFDAVTVASVDPAETSVATDVSTEPSPLAGVAAFSVREISLAPSREFRFIVVRTPEWLGGASHSLPHSRQRVARFPVPMLVDSARRPPAGRGWVLEPKWDGYRLLAVSQEGRARVWARHGPK